LARSRERLLVRRVVAATRQVELLEELAAQKASSRPKPMLLKMLVFVAERQKQGRVAPSKGELAAAAAAGSVNQMDGSRCLGTGGSRCWSKHGCKESASTQMGATRKRMKGGRKLCMVLMLLFKAVYRARKRPARLLECLLLHPAREKEALTVGAVEALRRARRRVTRSHKKTRAVAAQVPMHNPSRRPCREQRPAT
jgi:hypothetical protein